MQTTNHNAFKNFVLDQLRDIPDLQCRPMPNGYALYSDGRVFGIICQGSVYFKSTYANEEKRSARAGRPEAFKDYYEIPPFVLEDHQNLAGWAFKAMNLQPSNSPGNPF